MEERASSCAHNCSAVVHDSSRDSYDSVPSRIQDMFQILRQAIMASSAGTINSLRDAIAAERGIHFQLSSEKLALSGFE